MGQKQTREHLQQWYLKHIRPPYTPVQHCLIASYSTLPSQLSLHLEPSHNMSLG